MSDFVVQLFENPNLVTVDDADPNVVYVSVNGTQGAPGSTIISGSGPPTLAVGVIGDIYIDTDNPPQFYGPKTDTGWPSTPFFTLSSNRRYIFQQAVPASTWNIAHDLGGFPSVSVVDSAKTQVVGEVTYIDEENIRIEFSSAFSGEAYLT